MMRFNLFIVGLLILSPLFSQQTKIAFGSCSHQDDTLSIFSHILEKKPEYYVFLGDNIYGDTYIMDTLAAKYDRLKKNPFIQQVFQNTTVFGTWDDHDYGWDDIGKYYTYKKESAQLFWNFMEIPQDSPLRQRSGIYRSELKQLKKHRIQFIMLDVRSHRSNIRRFDSVQDSSLKDDSFFYDLLYVPTYSTDSSILGSDQWLWLEEQLKVPADVRIICSGTQFGIGYNGYEAWANFPKEQQKLLDLIKSTKANGVLFITGDVHYGEISKLNYAGLYPIYDVTSSGISETWYFPTPNENRIEGPVMDNNFGLITIDWKRKNTQLKMEIWDKHNNQRVEYTIPLSQLQF